ncbi:MAG: mandelate racemase/muconate lactonizing enzyme family protein [Desulfobacterales bacterium]|nr:MAG: mandelate racemase/muconate lactonizing enzyme family protein [Desulfobacterales bacterium]
MQIKDIQSAHYRIALPVVLSDSTHGDIPFFELITVKLQDNDGLEGVGYTYTVGCGGAAIRALINRDLKPVLLDEDPRRIEHLWNKMWWRLHWVGRGGLAAFAISAVDIALWDLKGQTQSEPLWRLLGGHSQRVQAYAGGIDLQFSTEELCAQTRQNLQNGFRAIKMKVGREKLSDDIARVQAVRELIGPEIVLMVDANMRWTVDAAIRAARVLRDYGIYWLEEPTLPEDVKGHARIAREGGLPIAAGENLHSIYEFRAMIEQGELSFPEPDVANMGGISAWMKVAQLALGNHLPITSHGVHDLHVHLLGAVANASYLEVHGFGLERFIADPLQIENGEALAPDRPGHGVSFNWEALAEYEVRA